MQSFHVDRATLSSHCALPVIAHFVKYSAVMPSRLIVKPSRFYVEG